MMIVYDLTCAAGHVFEGWFRDSAAFARQSASRRVHCPECGGVEVTRGPQAPNIASGVSRDKAVKAAEARGEMRAVLKALRRTVEDNAQYVGPDFAEEARKIHHGEVGSRPIYGEATADEAKALDEEGIAVTQIPWIEREDA